MSIPERYVRLCLRADRHIDGLVDAYCGPPEWRRAVEDAEPADLAELRDEADALLDALDDAELNGDRRRWLGGQLVALRCMLGRLTGEDLAWADEVGRCLGVRPTRTDTEVFTQVHRRLDAALPGSGSVQQRYAAWDADNAVPPDLLLPAIEALKEVLRPRAHELAPMPEDETVAYALVSDVPWIAYNWYEGGFRSGVEVNADLPVSVALLVDLTAHEVYPGHHTERVAKEARLYRELGRVETSVVITPSPESVVSEGLALLALEQALGDEPFEVVADALAGVGVRVDPAQAREVHRAEIALYAVGTNAAFMLHADGASEEEAQAYIREWALEPDDKAARSVSFITDPASRAYVPAYPEGRRLCAGFIGSGAGTFTQLLTEQLTPTDLTPTDLAPAQPVPALEGPAQD